MPLPAVAGLVAAAAFVGAAVAYCVTTIAHLRGERRTLRDQRDASEGRAACLADENRQLKHDLQNLGPVARNRLYRESLEDVSFGAGQALLRLRAWKAQVDEEMAVIEQLLARKD